MREKQKTAMRRLMEQHLKMAQTAQGMEAPKEKRPAKPISWHGHRGHLYQSGAQ
jgi:hypothetical protein